MTQIEKIARLMGIEYVVSGDRVWLQYDTSKREYNPLTNKVDLMDFECALGIDVLHDEEYITAEYWQHGLLEFDDKKRIANYAHNKFTARAAAVCAVAEQIYDHRTEGK